jgi:hypothetical protein
MGHRSLSRSRKTGTRPEFSQWDRTRVRLRWAARERAEPPRRDGLSAWARWPAPGGAESRVRGSARIESQPPIGPGCAGGRSDSAPPPDGWDRGAARAPETGPRRRARSRRPARERWDARARAQPPSRRRRARRATPPESDVIERGATDVSRIPRPSSTRMRAYPRESRWQGSVRAGQRPRGCRRDESASGYDRRRR